MGAFLLLERKGGEVDWGVGREGLAEKEEQETDLDVKIIIK